MAANPEPSSGDPGAGASRWIRRDRPGAIYCERCGARATRADRGAYCPRCRLHQCHECYGNDPPFCAACPATGWSGLRRARQALDVVAASAAELEALGAQPGSADRWRLADDAFALELRAEAAAAAVRLALAEVRPRQARRAETIRLESEVALARFHAVAEATRIGPKGPLAQLREWASLGAFAVAGLVLLVAALALNGSDRPPQATDTLTGQSARATPAPGSERAEVLGAGPASVEPTVSEMEPMEWSFDDLAMDTELTEGWEVAGPAGTAVVAAFPTPIDRSVRLRSATEDVAICHGTPTVMARLAVSARLYMEAVQPGITLLELRGSTVAAVRVGENGELMLGDAGTGAGIEPDRWYRFEMGLQQASVELRVLPAEGAGQVPIAVGRTALEGGVERVCVRIPGGLADADLYLDDLTLQ